MTEIDSTQRRVLPLVGGRSYLTCVYRCGNQCAHEPPNTSGNEYFGDVMSRVLSRRGLLRAGALVAGVGGIAGALPAAATAATTPARAGGALTFTPVAPNTRDDVTVPDGYGWDVVLRWGDPVLPGAPEFDFEHQTAEAQRQQFGYNCDYVMLFPLGPDRGLLTVNHEYTNEELMFHGWQGGASTTEEQIRISMAAHGMSVVEVERVGHTGRWRPAQRRHRNRRIHTHTPMLLTGPAAGSDLLKTKADPNGRWVLGMLNNCSGGRTPWGTVLTCEENFHQYFVGGDGAPEPAKPGLQRYGIPTDRRIPSSGYRGWERVDERFDLAKHPNEANRFGYVVEIDPYDPDFVPRKRTHLGRFKHEAANTTLSADRRVAVYLGDDERFEYIYKFVSRHRYLPGDSRKAREHNLRLLDEGTLYVARFTGDGTADGQYDGTGEWIPLVSGNVSHVPGMTAEEVLVFTRLAADKVGATKMDRPEDIERNPVTGEVYAALTNNTRRTPGQVDEANPRPANKHGHVLAIREAGDDAAAERFTWHIPLVCGDPNDPSTYFAGYDKSKVSPISCPDNLTFDAAGNLWIATDGNALGSNDGLFAMPVRGPERGHVKQFLTVPHGAETCGPLITADQRTCFVAVQHPGEVDGASADNPASTWPDRRGFPRPSVICVWRTGPGFPRIGA
ncbi:phosphatase [Carbonactinospora thermoautotrophica]|uniref:PhoX family protein n=1 Tax=Carbonactinospora thermoautotrophica TaxID=1469144 RepID=UPI00226F2CBE|nr:PhoX family phosphatase [Carbonactinospora thermoautotrophica]MCX9192103.1 phosphatase [Carbonactinospora thermoautotrophica]